MSGAKKVIWEVFSFMALIEAAGTQARGGWCDGLARGARDDNSL